MAYYQRVIQPSEVVSYVGRIHWLIYAYSIGFGCFSAGLLFGAIVSTTRDRQDAVLVLSMIFLVISAAAALKAWIFQTSTEIVVTSHRVLVKFGLISRRTMEMNMGKVESVDVRQGIVGRLFGYGVVVVRGTGSSIEPIKFVADPIGLRNAITAV